MSILTSIFCAVSLVGAYFAGRTTAHGDLHRASLERTPVEIGGRTVYIVPARRWIWVSFDALAYRHHRKARQEQARDVEYPDADTLVNETPPAR